MSAAATVLNENVLVLNKYFMPVHITTARRAFALLYKDAAEVVHPAHDRFDTYNFKSWAELSLLRDAFPDTADAGDWVRTVSFQIRIPRIIRLLGYERLPRQNVKFNRRNIYARDGNRCQYCGKKFPTSELSLDHITPRSRGGKSTWDNVVCACTSCNVRKGGRLLSECRMKLIQKPVRPKRSPLIDISLRSAKYKSWKTFVDSAYWTVELDE
ncbi:MAG: HNH endonuclease [Planctomycetota bacterium]